MWGSGDDRVAVASPGAFKREVREKVVTSPGALKRAVRQKVVTSPGALRSAAPDEVVTSPGALTVATHPRCHFQVHLIVELTA